MKELRLLLPYINRYKKLFILGFFFVSLSNICSTIYPKIVGDTVDLFAYSFTMGDISVRIALILLFTIGSGFFMFLTRKTIIVASRKIEYELRNDVIAKLERLPLAYYHKTATGELMAYVTNDISAAREFLGPAIMYTANALTTAVFALIMMLSVSPEVTFIALLPLPFISLSTYIIGGKVHILFKQVQDYYAKLTGRAQEVLSGVRVVRAYNREGFEQEVFGEMSRQYYLQNMKLAGMQSLSMPLMGALAGLSQLLALGFGGKAVIEGTITLGDLTQMFIYLAQLTWPVIAIGWVTNLIQRASASAARLGSVLYAPEAINNDNADSNLASVRGRIEFRNVSFSYGNHTNVLDNISLTIEEGETLALVGETGSGKSTFIQLLPRLYDVTSGTILIDGHDIRTLPLETLRQTIAVVPQVSFLFSATIEENIRFGNPKVTTEDVHKAAQMACLDEAIASFPEGYNTKVGERGVTLSGGQKQRTAIARALLRKPPILILDDALSAVDTETEERVLQGISGTLASRTSIVIAHRLSSIQHADRIAVLHEGKIAELGTHKELLEQKGIYADMFRRQLLEAELEHM